ncbi:MAG TPA: TolC family protein [Burkholderiales bacterium]|nr:TolC family protein [Burkholderiales bacterium]
MPVTRRISLMGLLLVSLMSSAHAAETLTLTRAEALAIERAPLLSHHRTNVNAVAERVVYEGRLPDPQLTVGAVNVPTDSWSLRDEDMTMLSVGVRQNIPAGDTLAARERRAQKTLSREEAMLEIQRRTLLRQLRHLWFELYAQEHSLDFIDRSRELQQRTLKAAEGRYRAAQEQQQVVLRERQALARLDEKALMVRSQIARVRAQLARYLGEAANDTLPTELAPLPPVPEFDVTRHPEWLAGQAGIDIAQAEVELTRQEYKPGVMLDLSYGFRRPMPNGTERSDMVTAMVTVDLPLFRSKRQDRRLAEKQSFETAARFELEDKQRELQAMYAAARAERDALEARVKLVAEQLLPDMRREAQVAAGFARDANLRREAQMKALDAELELLRLHAEHAKSAAELLYLTGEPQS